MKNTLSSLENTLKSDLNAVIKEQIEDTEEMIKHLEEKKSMLKVRLLSTESVYCECPIDTREIEKGANPNEYYCTNLDCGKQINPDFEPEPDLDTNSEVL